LGLNVSRLQVSTLRRNSETAHELTKALNVSDRRDEHEQRDSRNSGNNDDDFELPLLSSGRDDPLSEGQT
jgi:hypothetical protein